jgi:hypothetical protein
MLVRSSLVIAGSAWAGYPGRRLGGRRRREKRTAAGNDFMAAGHYPQRPARQSRVTSAGRSRSSAGNSYLVPQPAVQVEVIAVGLAGGGISDVGVQGMPVVGGLRRAV